MTDFITLTCPSCGGDLKITKDIERFACAHCGKQHIVNRGGGIISIAPVLENVSKGVDSTASELALIRLEKELAEIKPQLKKAKENAKSLQDEAQRRIPALIGTIILLLSSILLFIFTNLSWLPLILLLVGIALIGYTYHLHSKEFLDTLNEATENAQAFQEKYDLIKENHSFHYDRANKK